jgi:hypothetical protein
MDVDQALTEAGEPIGWLVTDPDGNIVASGPVTEAKAAAWVGELIEQARNSTEGQE